MQTTTFGRLDSRVSRVGLGGEGVLRTYGRQREARTVITAALKQGITYFDSARVYADSELYYGSVWAEEGDRRQAVFQTSKSAARDRQGAWADLRSSLQRLHTDYLDLWQIHDVRTMAELAAIARPGGALEAFVEAREQGLVRAIGVTGHHDPYVLTEAVTNWPVDAVLMPVNPVEGTIGGFLSQTLPAARKKGLAVIAMKVLGASHYVLPKLEVTAEMLIRYALSFDVTLAIVGCATVDEVRTLAGQAGASPMSGQERRDLEAVFRPYADRLAFYRKGR